MLTIHPLDPAFPIESQFADQASPVELVNIFTLNGFDEASFLRLWQEDADFMKRQPGFVSTQLHRAVGQSDIYLNHATWESVEAFRAAFTNPAFLAKLSDYPSMVMATPYLFRKVDEPGATTE
ncbi:MAG: antibiotic biosynthesis monooxygenase [Pseudodesulfovibrio sp.]|uniref:antibiotic biosynthesis monooxygenase family protein n=1 Tax=Pseudodesulfovibrio sp. TaxID=2035812 RepID=UPI003D0AD570